MDSSVFLDTVGLIALLNKDDSYHEVAAEVFRSIGGSNRRIVTTNLVLAEVGNSLSRTTLKREVVWLINQLSTNSRSRVEFVDSTLFGKGLKLYENRDDKTWGLVDCVSFALMADLCVTHAFTADSHFEQAGFECMLKLARQA